MDYTHQGYNSGHPWYYLLGGKRLSLKEIRHSAEVRGYRGYMERELDEADSKAEPKRSEMLRAMRTETMSWLASDVSRYRECSKLLARRRQAIDVENTDGACADVHTDISLKHNHIYNRFAHLSALDDLLSKQLDFFG